MTSPDPLWVDRLCTVVERWRASQQSIQELFREATPDLSSAADFHWAVARRLRQDPSLVDRWEMYAGDKRSSGSPYLSGHEVGRYDGGGLVEVVHHEDRIEACADYLYREARSVLDP